MPDPAEGTPPGEPQLPDYLREFIGQFLADPQRVNMEMAFEFLRDFYAWAAEEFADAREYSESQMTAIDSWRSTFGEPAGD